MAFSIAKIAPAEEVKHVHQMLVMRAKIKVNSNSFVYDLLSMTDIMLLLNVGIDTQTVSTYV